MNTFLEDARLKILTLLVLGALGLFLLIQCVAAVIAIEKKDGMMPSNVISVRGTGEAVGTPDIATFYFTVRETNKDVAAAQGAMKEKAEKAISYLKEQGVDPKDIKTESYYTNPTYEYTDSVCTPYMCPPSKQTVSGYEVSETIVVKVREMKKAGDHLTNIANLKIGEVSGLSFAIDDRDALKAEAKKQAIEKAKIDAERIADALGVDLGDVVSFYEEYPYDQPYDSYEREMSMSSTKMQNYGSVPLEAGETKVTASVSVSYELDN